ncbi:hypothetical protein D3C78_1546020 [compost metagenome]
MNRLTDILDAEPPGRQQPRSQRQPSKAMIQLAQQQTQYNGRHQASVHCVATDDRDIQAFQADSPALEQHFTETYDEIGYEQYA